jgi:predicted RNA-binding protein with PIN domain
MAFVRIIVDGDSLLRQWTDLAPGKTRSSAAAREELLIRLTQYYDATGTPISVVFCAAQPGNDTDEPRSSREVEVLLSRAGQTVDQVVKRVLHRFRPNGEALVVTDNSAASEFDAPPGTVLSDCARFIRALETTLQDLEREITSFNQQERNRFLRAS